jgi:hypothetical protein
MGNARALKHGKYTREMQALKKMVRARLRAARKAIALTYKIVRKKKPEGRNETCAHIRRGRAAQPSLLPPPGKAKQP